MPLNKLPRLWRAVSSNQVSLFECWRSLCFSHSDGCSEISQQCIYPKACNPSPSPSLQPLQKLKSSRLSVSSQIVLQMETINYFEPSVSYHCRFHKEGEGTRHPKSPEALSHCRSSDLCPLNPSEDLVRLCTHMLIGNLYAFLYYYWTFLSLFKPLKLNHLTIFTTDGAGWMAECAVAFTH